MMDVALVNDGPVGLKRTFFGDELDPLNSVDMSRRLIIR